MARAMKDSGVEWLGDIPVDWNVIKLKYLFSIIGGNGFPDILQGNSNGDYPFCKVSDINDEADYVNTASNWVAQSVVDSNHFNVIPIGSIIMAKIGVALSKNHRKINTIKCCIDNNTQALVPKRDDNLRYLLYLSKCIDMSWFDNNSTVPSVSNPKLLNFFVPNVSQSEQRLIADFLDSECARIDSIVEKTRASIEEYKKLKQAIITRAVTKGIRPNRPMKDSYIEWLGDIPADWELAQLKRFVFVNNGRETLDEVDKTEDVVPVYGSGGVFKYTTTPLYSGETVMFGRKGTLGKPIYANEKLWTVDTMYFLTFSEKLFAKFNYYQLCAFDWEPHITQTALPSIVASEIVSCKFAFPPIDGQKEIAAYLDEKTAAINSLIAKKNQLVTELESLKKSLIFEYVTGKKEVPT